MLLEGMIMLAMLKIPGIGRETVRKINEGMKNERKKNVDAVYEKMFYMAKKSKRINLCSKESFVKLIEEISSIIEKQKCNGIELVTINDEEFPAKLKRNSGLPVFLFVKGNLEVLNKKKQIAIIGSREISKQGALKTRTVAQTVAKRGCTIISGLALGCDTYAHKSCLEITGNTIAVLPGPIDNIYPKNNEKLANEIIDAGGLLISEYYGDNPISKSNFVERDRIQAGLSDGIIIIETKPDGGTMQTVKYAEKYKRRIACLKYKEEYMSQYQLAGNLKLIGEKRATSISKFADLDSFIQEIEQSELKQNDLEQMSFF